MAAQKPLSTTAAERMNLVAQDEIWRYRLKAEYKAQEEWPMKWGYLMTSMEKVIEKFIRNHLSPGSTQSCQEINGHHLIISKNELKEGAEEMALWLLEGEEEPRTPKPKIELPSHFRVRPVSPMDKYIKILPSPPIPKTTQSFIGWRSGVPGLNKCLEHDTEIRSCKGAYARELHWPEQGVY